MEMNNSINNDLQDEYVNDNSIKKNEDANEKEVDEPKNSSASISKATTRI